MNDFAASTGFTNIANKQYALARQVQSNKQNKVQEEETSGNQKGTVSNEGIADITNPTIIADVKALEIQEEVSSNRKRYQPTIDSLKERMERSLEDRYDNAHNMLAEAFYGFKVSTCSSLLGLLGANPAELEEIQKKAYEQAKLKVNAGYERLATAYAEYEIYAS